MHWVGNDLSQRVLLRRVTSTYVDDMEALSVVIQPSKSGFVGTRASAYKAFEPRAMAIR